MLAHVHRSSSGVHPSNVHHKMHCVCVCVCVCACVCACISDLMLTRVYFSAAPFHGPCLTTFRRQESITQGTCHFMREIL